MADVEPWYNRLREYFGAEFCERAGYFEEDKPFNFRYRDHFDLPVDEVVVHYPGAFHPFHEGHLESLMRAVDHVIELHNMVVTVVVHIDHDLYRTAKGYYDAEHDEEALKLLNGFKAQYEDYIDVLIVRENDIKDNCSRNFTRLYQELWEDNKVYMVCGGDRANFALSFIERGACIVSGRDRHPNFSRYEGLSRQLDHLIFLNGNNPTSSTAIRLGQ